MNIIESVNSDPIVKTALGLMVEYTPKLRAIKKRLREARNRASMMPRIDDAGEVDHTAHHNSAIRFMKLKNDYESRIKPLKELASFISQRIEFTDDHALDKINLALKLRDMEDELASIEKILNS